MAPVMSVMVSDCTSNVTRCVTVPWCVVTHAERSVDCRVTAVSSVRPSVATASVSSSVPRPVLPVRSHVSVSVLIISVLWFAVNPVMMTPAPNHVTSLSAVAILVLVSVESHVLNSAESVTLHPHSPT